MKSFIVMVCRIACLVAVIWAICSINTTLNTLEITADTLEITADALESLERTIDTLERAARGEVIGDVAATELKWSEMFTWRENSHLIKETPERWEWLSESPFIRFETEHQEKAKYGVWLPKIEPGEYAAKVTTTPFNILFPEDYHSIREFIYAGIYNEGRADSLLSGGSGIRFVCYEPPERGRLLKVIVYRLTPEELAEAR